MTNAGFFLSDPGFHEGLREVSRRHGTLLGIDETHTLVSAYGGLTTQWALEPDLLTVGKSIAGGVALGAYGMTDDEAQVLRPPRGGAAVAGIAYDEVATGGTLFGNALSMVAARAALTEVLTPEAFTATAKLGEQLATGLRALIEGAGLPWSVTITARTPSTSSARSLRDMHVTPGPRTTPSCARSSGCSSRTAGSGNLAGGWGLRNLSLILRRRWTSTLPRSGSV